MKTNKLSIVCGFFAAIVTLGFTLTACGGNAPTVPGNVKAAAATSANSGSITVTWSSVSGATGYSVYRSESESGPYKYKGSIRQTNQTSYGGYTSSPPTSFSDTGLPINTTTYYYKVSAYNSNGESDQSSSASAATRYTVTFDLNNGYGSAPSAQTVNAGSNTTLPNGNGFSRSGYAFGGWNTNEYGHGTNYAAGASYTVSGNVTLYANWLADGTATYTVTFNINGGSGTTPSAQTVTPGNSITLPNGFGFSFSRSGYAFGGWNTQANGTGTNYAAGASYTVTGTVTLYAQWNTVYTVTFNINGGSGTTPSAQTVSAGDSIILPSGSGFSRSGYTFGGWNTNSYGTGTNYNGDSSYAFTGDITLYAKWDTGNQTGTGNPVYTVTFNINGGTGTVPPAQTANAGSSIILPRGIGLTRTGYTFGGWNTQANGTGTNYNATSSYTPTSDITLYAKWNTGGQTGTGNPVYTVTYNINGGNGTVPTAQTAGYGSSITLPSGSGLTRTGYTFGGWNTQANGTGTNYNATSSYTPTSDITLYAKWNTGGQTGTGSQSVSIEMVYVSGGSFTMGSNDSLDYGASPPHTVTLTGFYIGKYEVTQGQYQAVMGSNPASGYGVGANYPVYSVSWYDAVVFCNKLSMAEGLTPAYRINNSTDPSAWGSVPTSGNNSTWDAATIVSGATGYRLPTEAQWEYAAKGGNGSPGNYTYSGSNTAGDVAWYDGNNSPYGSKEVGTKAANGLGIYDMSGNVWEWCWDWFGSYSSTAQTDPVGASSGSLRVVRGGVWLHSAEIVRSANRGSVNPINRNNYGGFRLVRP